ncbi:MAG TPA: hypothetical protein VEC99_13180 [Clostridia bacterium]|nr:hypothetical protein [Clostridia bacterium]
MQAGKRVRLTKLRESAHPQVRAGRWDTYRPGAWDNTESLPVDYEMVGVLVAPPLVGKRVELLRLERNGEPALGVFVSSPVTEVNHTWFATRNSVYRIEVLHDEG